MSDMIDAVFYLVVGKGRYSYDLGTPKLFVKKPAIQEAVRSIVRDMLEPQEPKADE